MKHDESKKTDCPARADDKSGPPSWRAVEPELTWVRPTVQIGFLVFSLMVGWQFHVFVNWLADPVTRPPERPPSVEAWLPISSLMSLTYSLRTGQVNLVHPAGLVIFSLILGLSIFMGRGFCSWVCPIGTLSEWAHGIGRRLIGRNFVPPSWIDLPLRSLKYLLLAFFVYAIVGMSSAAILAFLEGPYNRIADVKMYLLFAEMTRTTAVVLIVLAALSLLVKNAWCRYLCPYGALLGLSALVAPLAVRRDADRCTDCKRCDQACPNRVRVSTCRDRIISLECTSCYRCVESCRVPGTLAIRWPVPGRAVNQAVYAAVLVGAFMLVAQAASSTGYWRSSTSSGLYAALYRVISQTEHPRTPSTLSNERPQPLPPRIFQDCPRE